MRRFFAVLLISTALSFQIRAQSLRQYLPLQLTFPAAGDSFAVDRLRIAGFTAADARVQVNGRPVRVYTSGAFVDRVDLRAGWNTIYFRAQRDDELRSDSLHVYRIPSVESSPYMPTAIDSGFYQPRTDIWLSSGDVLNVQFKGSPGGHGRFAVDGLIKDVPMAELPVRGSVEWAGLYHGVLKLDAQVVSKKLKISVELKGLDGRTARAEIPGRVYVMSEKLPLVGLTRTETELWNAGEQGVRLGKVPPFVRVHIVGKIGRRYKIRLSPAHVGYLERQDVRLLSAGEPLPQTWVAAPMIGSDRQRIRLTFELGRAVPAIVHQSVDPAGLDLYLFGAVLEQEWVTWPNQELELLRLKGEQLADGVVKFHVDLLQAQQWGYGIDYQENQLIWSIQRPISISASAAKPLQGLSVCVDPGHGGDDPGAIGVAGTVEKEVNLRLALLFAERLRAAGARPVLTRDDDRAATPKERLEFARQSACHLFVSLHNNSIGADAHPLRVRGNSVYFYQPQSQALAWAVYPHLTGLGLEPFGRNQAGFYVLRLTEMPAILVECAFLSHPEEEILLNDDRFLKRFAGALVDGLIDFIRPVERLADQ